MQEQHPDESQTEAGWLAAPEAIRRVKARCFRGVDTEGSRLVRDILAEDCGLDYDRCFVDPTTKTDYVPGMSIVVRGRSAWPNRSLPSMRVVRVHNSI